MIAVGKRLVAVLCALVLLLVTVVHRPVVADPNHDSGLAAFLALGGSLHDLCLNGDVEGGGDDPGRHDCPACTLAKIAALLPTVAAVGISAEWPADQPLWHNGSFVAQHGARAPPARGPPASRMT